MAIISGLVNYWSEIQQGKMWLRLNGQDILRYPVVALGASNVSILIRAIQNIAISAICSGVLPTGACSVLESDQYYISSIATSLVGLYLLNKSKSTIKQFIGNNPVSSLVAILAILSNNQLSSAVCAFVVGIAEKLSKEEGKKEAEKELNDKIQKDVEVIRLKNENNRLNEENEVLKKILEEWKERLGNQEALNLELRKQLLMKESQGRYEEQNLYDPVAFIIQKIGAVMKRLPPKNQDILQKMFKEIDQNAEYKRLFLNKCYFALMEGENELLQYLKNLLEAPNFRAFF